MNSKNLMRAAAAAVMCLAIAGCDKSMYPGDRAGLNDMSAEEAWDTGFKDGATGVPNGKDELDYYQPSYQEGYTTGANYKAHPLGPKPINPYNNSPPASYHPPSAGGGG